MKSIGLALGGGGLKGMAHIGVLQVLHENGLRPQYITGTSAGSVIASLYASGISPYQLEAIALQIKPSDYLDYNLLGIFRYLLSLVCPFCKSPPLEGIILGDKLENLIDELTQGKQLAQIRMPLSLIACDINSGRKIVFTNQAMEIEKSDVQMIRDARVSEAVRSSSSIPVTFVPKNYCGLKMVDGGVKEIVPASVAKIMGAEYVVSVNLGQEMYDTQVKGIPEIISRTLGILVFETSEMEEEIYSDLTIFPGIKPIPLNDTDAIARIIRAGRRAMQENIEALKKQVR